MDHLIVSAHLQARRPGKGEVIKCHLTNAPLVTVQTNHLLQLLVDRGIESEGVRSAEADLWDAIDEVVVGCVRGVALGLEVECCKAR